MSDPIGAAIDPPIADETDEPARIVACAQCGEKFVDEELKVCTCGMAICSGCEPRHVVVDCEDA